MTSRLQRRAFWSVAGIYGLHNSCFAALDGLSGGPEVSVNIVLVAAAILAIIIKFLSALFTYSSRKIKGVDSKEIDKSDVAPDQDKRLDANLLKAYLFLALYVFVNWIPFVDNLKFKFSWLNYVGLPIVPATIGILLLWLAWMISKRLNHPSLNSKSKYLIAVFEALFLVAVVVLYASAYPLMTVGYLVFCIPLIILVRGLI